MTGIGKEGSQAMRGCLYYAECAPSMHSEHNGLWDAGNGQTDTRLETRPDFLDQHMKIWKTIFTECAGTEAIAPNPV